MRRCDGATSGRASSVLTAAPRTTRAAAILAASLRQATFVPHAMSAVPSSFDLLRDSIRLVSCYTQLLRKRSGGILYRRASAAQRPRSLDHHLLRRRGRFGTGNHDDDFA